MAASAPNKLDRLENLALRLVPTMVQPSVVPITVPEKLPDKAWVDFPMWAYFAPGSMQMFRDEGSWNALKDAYSKTASLGLSPLVFESFAPHYVAPYYAIITERLVNIDNLEDPKVVAQTENVKTKARALNLEPKTFARTLSGRIVGVTFQATAAPSSA
jgi:hypothetical protein